MLLIQQVLRLLLISPLLAVPATATARQRPAPCLPFPLLGLAAAVYARTQRYIERAFSDRKVLSVAGPSPLSLDVQGAWAVLAAAADEAYLCRRQKQLSDAEELVAGWDSLTMPPLHSQRTQRHLWRPWLIPRRRCQRPCAPHCTLRVSGTAEEIPAQNSRRWQVSATTPSHGGTAAGTACCAGRNGTQNTADPTSGRSAGVRTCCPGSSSRNDSDSACLK